MRKHVVKLAEEDGFTLLETLVTVAIVSLLSMIVVGALGQVRTMTAVSHKTDQEVRYGAILNYLETTLANARPVRLLGRSDGDPVVMDGSSDHVEFVAIVKTGTSTQSFRDVVWKNSNDGNHSQFDQVTTPRRLQPEQQTGLTTVIAGGDVSVAFRYLADDRKETGGQLWLNEWKSDHLPGAIQIDIKANDGTRPITLTRLFPIDGGPAASR